MVFYIGSFYETYISDIYIEFKDEMISEFWK